MNCNTYKEETMQFLKIVADKKAERMRMARDRQKEVGETMHYFHMKQASLKKELMQDAKKLRDLLSKEDSHRLAEFHEFSKQLTKEGKERMKGRMMLGTNVNHMLNEFHSKQHALSKELNQKSKDLHTLMKKQESDRLHGFETFHKKLEQEKKSCQMKTLHHVIETQKFLNQCHEHQADMAKALQDQFGSFRKARQEIQACWAKISANSDMHMTANFAKPHREREALKEQMESPGTTPSGAQETMQENTNDLLMKLKATISGFHEGCRFSELHRALGDVSKTATREALNQLLSGKEIRKDENDRFHLI